MFCLDIRELDDIIQRLPRLHSTTSGIRINGAGTRNRLLALMLRIYRFDVKETATSHTVQSRQSMLVSWCFDTEFWLGGRKPKGSLQACVVWWKSWHICGMFDSCVSACQSCQPFFQARRYSVCYKQKRQLLMKRKWSLPPAAYSCNLSGPCSNHSLHIRLSMTLSHTALR